jgi:hypothetical protein
MTARLAIARSEIAMAILHDVDPSRLLGLKIFMIGLIVAVVGFLMALAGQITIGWLVGWGGSIVGIAGMGLHLLLMLKHLMKRNKADVPLEGK